MHEERHQLDYSDYELSVSGQDQDWTWTLLRHQAVAARGSEPDRVSAWRSGAFVAQTIASLEIIGRRRF